MIAGAFGAVLAVAYGLFQGHKALVARKVFEFALPIVWHLVDEVSKHTANTVDDKVAFGLQKLVEYMDGHGLKTTDAQMAEAKDIFMAMHAASVGRAK